MIGEPEETYTSSSIWNLLRIGWFCYTWPEVSCKLEAPGGLTERWWREVHAALERMVLLCRWNAALLLASGLCCGRPMCVCVERRKRWPLSVRFCRTAQRPRFFETLAGNPKGRDKKGLTWGLVELHLSQYGDRSPTKPRPPSPEPEPKPKKPSMFFVVVGLDFGGWTWHLIWHRDRERDA
jgi:hypothetical protein